MSRATVFPDPVWISKSITFTHPSPSTWILSEKIDEQSFPSTEEEAKKYLELPSAWAKFKCYNSVEPEEKGVMMIEMQIPYEGTEYYPQPDRQQQASEQGSTSMKLWIDAYERLFNKMAKGTPTLLGTLKEKQPMTSALVPGGSIQYLAYSAVPGIPLGNGCLSYRQDGRSQEDGPFWRFSREERDKIRSAFEPAYRDLLVADVDMSSMPSLEQIYWDRTSNKLFICGQFEPLNSDGWPGIVFDPLPFGTKALDVWGLALPPEDNVDYNIAIPDLEKSGWVL